MVLAYEDDKNKKSQFLALGRILEECGNWFSQVAFIVAYHDERIAQDNIVQPVSFMKWQIEATADGSFSEDAIQGIVKIYNEMITTGQSLMQMVDGQKRPTRADFENFQSIYNGFVSRIRRIEKDSAEEGGNLDATTGLRNYILVSQDLKREMERLSRQKVPFSLLMSRIDGFKEGETNAVIQPVVKSIKECMRTFDDAYYCENGYFLLSLKHSDISGAQALANRLKQFIDEFSDGGEEITLSHCLTEPNVGDDVDELLVNMRKDLEAHSGEVDTILKFIEVSPLERFMSSMD